MNSGLTTLYFQIKLHFYYKNKLNYIIRNRLKTVIKYDRIYKTWEQTYPIKLNYIIEKGGVYENSKKR